MNYQIGLRLFFELIYPESKEDLDILSEKYIAEDRDHRNDVLDFKDSLRDKAPKTISSRLNVVRCFLDENGIDFPKRFFKNLNGKVNQPISEERVPSNEELRRIIEYLPVQGKALALVLSSSGMRIGESLQIKIKDIDLTRALVKIKIRAEYTKTGKKRITFISPEAKLAVEEWFEYRKQYLVRADGRSWKYGRKDDGKLFPFTNANFNQIWRNALGKAKLFDLDEKTKRVTMRPHNLRKFFRLRVGRYGRDEAEAMMGHQKGLNSVYARFVGEDGDKRLEEVYKKAIPDLSIYERTIKSTRIQMEILQENQKLQEELKTTLIDQSILIQKIWREKDFSDSKIANLVRSYQSLRLK
jgi:integrase